jgi:hypothetical protein
LVNLKSDPVCVGIAFEDSATNSTDQVGKTCWLSPDRLITDRVSSGVTRHPRLVNRLLGASSLDAEVVNRETNCSRELNGVIESRGNRLSRICPDQNIHDDFTVGYESDPAIFHLDHSPGSFSEVVEILER